MRWGCLFPDGSMNVHAGDEDTQRRRAQDERDRWNASLGLPQCFTLPQHRASVVRLVISQIEEVP